MSQRKPTRFLTRVSFSIGILCAVLAFFMVLVLFLPGGEYGRYAGLFNLFFPWSYLIGPMLGTAVIVLGVVGWAFSDDRKDSMLGIWGIVFGVLPNAVTLILVVLFFFGSAILIVKGPN